MLPCAHLNAIITMVDAQKFSVNRENDSNNNYASATKKQRRHYVFRSPIWPSVRPLSVNTVTEASTMFFPVFVNRSVAMAEQ